MSRLYSRILTRSAELALLALLLLIAACGESSLEVQTESLDRRLPDETSTGVTITEFDQGRIAYVLKAEKIDRFYDRRILNAYKVDITAYDSKGTKSLLKADSTIVDDARNQIFAYGNVSLISPGGNVSSGRMVWDRNADEIMAPGQVTLVQDGNVLRGTNLRTNLSVYPTEMDSVSAEGFFEEDYLDW